MIRQLRTRPGSRPKQDMAALHLLAHPLIVYFVTLGLISNNFGVSEGQTITPVYVQINASVTLTCPADDQATTLTWTGPGGHLWVTGTALEDDMNASGSRISAGHSGGSYTLTFTLVLAMDTGIYTCTVDGTVGLHMVIVQGVTSASPVYTRQGGTVILQCTDISDTNAQWQVTSPAVFTYTIETDINPFVPESTRTRLSVTRQDGNYNLQISDIQLSDVRNYWCRIGPTNTYHDLLLYIPPTFPEIENIVTVDGQNRTTGTEDGNLTLTCNAGGGTPAASVSWITDGATLKTSDNKVQYTKVFRRADDRTLFTCQSSSPALTSPQTTSVLVYLDLKPQQPTISDPSSQTENTDLQLVCVSTGSRPAADIEWNVGGTWLSSNPEEVKVLDSSTDTYTVTSSLSRRVTRQDNGEFVYCRVSNRALYGGIESVLQTITVLYGPDSVSITGNRVVVADGTNNLTLTCTTQEYNRHVHITWYNGTTRIPNIAAVTNTSGSYGGLISSQVLQLVPDRYQDGNVVRCVVQNEDATLGERTASVTLDINYRPYITLTPTTGTTVIEGRQLEIRCDVDSNPASSSVTWSKVGGQLPPDADVTSGVLRIPSTHRTDSGTYQCTAVNSVGTGQSSLVIDIQYPPDIHVLYTNTTYTVTDRVLTCVPDGNPNSYQFGQWRHTAEDGTEIRQLTGSSNTTHSVLTLPDPGMIRRYEDTGHYACTASNNITDVSTSRTGSVFFVVKAAPIVITNTTVVKGQIGNNVTIEVDIYSRPAVSLSDVTWTKGTTGSPPPDRAVTALHNRQVRLPFHGVESQVKGYVAGITMQSLVEQDFSNYTVTIRNTQGMTSYQIVLKSASPPAPPDNFEQLTHDSSSITVQWTPRFNGGAEQQFVIGYRTDNTKEFIELGPIPDQHEPTQSYQITGLTAGTTHYIRMYAENEIGRSVDVYLNQTTAAAVGQGPGIGALVGGIAGSAVGLIIVIVVVVICYRHRTTDKDGDMEMINSNGGRLKEENSDGIKPNILYESSDGLKANVLYESAGANYLPESGPSSEYASVSKPKKQNGDAGDPSSMYAVVDKSGKDKEENPKNDVYAEVKKLPKEKGGKGGKEQKKQINKKKQNEKQKQKDAKKQDKKAEKVSAGDEYENINSVQEKTDAVYANSSNSEESKDTPSRKKNQDGLVYLDVEFKDGDNNERRAIIHGIENRTDYADVDFSKRADPLPDEDDKNK